jgi:DnaK suppressor protein
MDAKNLAYFKRLLSTDLERLLRQEVDTKTALLNTERVCPDWVDQALVESNLNFKLHIRNRERKLINKIKNALMRIENGTYGICELCGEDIPIKRLKVRPVTDYCIECKSAAEIQERVLQSGGALNLPAMARR